MMAKTPAACLLSCVLLAGTAIAAAPGMQSPGFSRQQPPKISGAEAQALPDLRVASIKFEKLSQQSNAWLFKVHITVKNHGGNTNEFFQVLLQRNNGAGGSFQKACANCEFSVFGLNGGQVKQTPALQFNNSSNPNPVFRAIVDSKNTVSESNENNNTATATFVP